MSKQIIDGTVEKVFAKEKEEDQWGNKYFLSAKIGDNWVGFGGKKQPQINYKVGKEWKALQEGDVVEVVAETNAKGYLQAKSSDITVKESGNADAGNNSANRANSYNNPTRGVAGSTTSVSNDQRQDSIMRQSAMGYAAKIVAAHLPQNAEGTAVDYDKAAAEVVRIADEHFLPYAKKGRLKGVQESEIERKNEQQGQQHHQAEEDFSDDIPF